jgi:Flp pilus assembly protein TadB
VRFLRTCDALGIRPSVFNLISAMAAAAAFAAGLFLCGGNVLDALGFALAGWYFAGFFLERSAAEVLARTNEQLGAFVSVFADRAAQGATMEEALAAGARVLDEGALSEHARLAVRQMTHHVAFADAAREFAQRVRRPVAALWAELAAKGREGGGDSAKALRLMSWFMHENERVTEELRGALGGYISLTAWMTATIPGALLIERLADPAMWHALVFHAGWFLTAACAAMAWLIRGLRNYAGMEADVVTMDV